jgi:hypothetical protein
MHEPLQNEFFWRVTIPGTDYTIWEGMMTRTMGNLLAALFLCGVCCLAMFAWYRVSNWSYAERRVNNEG